MPPINAALEIGVERFGPIDRTIVVGVVAVKSTGVLTGARIGHSWIREVRGLSSKLPNSIFTPVTLVISGGIIVAQSSMQHGCFIVFYSYIMVALSKSKVVVE
ncbi:MAG: hypothetical protein WBG70_14705 [Spirulinaceae cyanobacterium]